MKKRLISLMLCAALFAICVGTTSAADDTVQSQMTGTISPTAAAVLDEQQLEAVEEIAARIEPTAQSELPDPGTDDPVIVVAQSDPVSARALAEIPGAAYVSKWVYPEGNESLGTSAYTPQTTMMDPKFSGSYTSQLTGLAAEIARAMTVGDTNGVALTRESAKQGKSLIIDVTAYLAGKTYSDAVLNSFVNGELRTAFMTALNAVMADDPAAYEWIGYTNSAHSHEGLRYGVSMLSNGSGVTETATATITLDDNPFCTDEALAIRDAALAEIVENAPHQSAAGDVKYFHDIVCELAVYNNSVLSLSAPLQVESGYYAHTSFGPFLAQNGGYEEYFIGGNAVCESYAHIFKALCDLDAEYFEIPCVLLTSLVTANATKGVDGHAWNAVQGEDGIWYLVDATWDDRVGATPKYTYFYQPPMVSDDYGTSYHTPCGKFTMTGGTALTVPLVNSAPRATAAVLSAEKNNILVGEESTLSWSISPAGAALPWPPQLQVDGDAFEANGISAAAKKRGSGELTASDPLGLVAVTGNVTLRAGLAGDANDDGEADVQDLVQLASIITGALPADDFALAMGDRNRDGVLDVRDLAVCAAEITAKSA